MKKTIIRDYTVNIDDDVMNYIRRNTGDNLETDEQRIYGYLYIKYYHDRKHEIFMKYFGYGGSENYAAYQRELEEFKRKDRNTEYTTERQLYRMKKEREANEDWENGPDDHRLYPDNNKDCRK